MNTVYKLFDLQEFQCELQTMSCHHSQQMNGNKVQGQVGIHQGRWLMKVVVGNWELQAEVDYVAGVQRSTSKPRRVGGSPKVYYLEGPSSVMQSEGTMPSAEPELNEAEGKGIHVSEKGNLPETREGDGLHQGHSGYHEDDGAAKGPG